jgi:hypothetical protein
MTVNTQQASINNADRDLYAREKVLNSAIIAADISSGWESYLEIFDAFYLTPSVPETAFSNCATQETYSVSLPIALATAIIDRAEMPDQAFIRVVTTGFDQDSIRGRRLRPSGFRAADAQCRDVSLG